MAEDGKSDGQTDRNSKDGRKKGRMDGQHQRDVIVICHLSVASQRIQDFLEAFFHTFQYETN